MGYSRVSKAASRDLLWVLLSIVGSGVVLSSCTVAVAGGVGVAMLGGAALTAGCYDPVNITVFDGVTGLRACDARVVARSTEGAEATFLSCFHAELPVGTWTVSAHRLGYEPVSAQLVVSKGKRCEPAVQSIEVSMMPLGVPRAAPVAIRPPRPGEAPLSPGALPAPASIGVEQAAPPAAAPTAEPPAVSSSTAPSAAPVSSGNVPPAAPPTAGVPPLLSPPATSATPPAGSPAPAPSSSSPSPSR